MKKTEALIIGAGPTGLTLAINLLRNGINCKVIDKRSSSYTSGSKAITVNAATLKLYQNIGIVDKFINRGRIVNDIYVHWHKSKLMHVNYRYLDSSYKYFLSIPQPESESILRECFLNLGGSIDFCTELIAISNEGPENIDVLLMTNGTKYNQKTSYLIGCDGAKSKVRDILGAKFIGRDYGMFFELIDVYIDWDGNQAATHYYVVEDCFVIIIPMTGNKHRIVIKNNIDNYEQMQVEKPISYYENIISHCGVLNLKIKNILWRSFSKFYNRLIDSYHSTNNIFFAGDACHLFSPIGGLGMNTGVQDAFNLSWRISGVLLGKYNEQILTEYNTERRFIGEQLVKSTDASTELITRLDKKSNGALANWLPVMKNRKNIKQDFPLNFSGLAHNYQLNNKVIYHMPFAFGVDVIANKDISSYDIADGIHFNVLLFVDQIELLFSQIQALSLDSSIKMWHITHKMNVHTNQKNITGLILDNRNEFYSKFTNNSESDIIVIRPDGYIGFGCKLENVQSLQPYFKYYFK